MQQSTLLILSCGANAPHHFIRTIKEHYAKSIRLVGVDVNKRWLVASSNYLDVFYQCPLSTNPKYYQFILDVCNKEGVNFILPLLDYDQVLFYKENPDLIAKNIVSLGLSEKTIKSFTDGSLEVITKQHIQKKLEANSIPVPFVVNSISDIRDDSSYFVKPIDGYGSVGIGEYMGCDLKNIDLHAHIVQEKCYRPEITVECFLYNGFLSTIARERIASKSGVCTKTRISHNVELESIVRDITKIVDLPMYFNLQFMMNSNQEYVITDMNLRSAGGMSLSYAVGWDVVGAIVAVILNHDSSEIIKNVTPPQEEFYVVRAYTDIVTKKVKKRIGFDLDGTLLNSKPRHIQVMRDILKKYNIEISCDGLVDYKSNGFNTLTWLLEQGIIHDLAKDITDEWVNNIELEQYLKIDTLYPNVVELLLNLSKDYDLYIITARKNKQHLMDQLSMIGIMDYVTDVCVVNPMANPAISKMEYIQRQKIDILVGDTEVDYEAAKIAKVDFYAITHGFRSVEFWNKYNVKYFEDANL